MRILICAGEKSGFVFADCLEQAIMGLSTSAAVARLDVGRETGQIIGFWEGLLAGLRKRQGLGRLWQEVKRFEPDLVILVGYPGVNLFLGKRCRRAGVRVIYLAPPQVWAWGRFRVKLLQAAADRVICLFGFEEQFLRKCGLNAVYYGYPLLDQVVLSSSRAETLRRIGFNPQTEYIAFLPGSRSSEINYHKLLFVEVFKRLKSRYPELKGVMVGDGEGELSEGLHWSKEKGRYDVIGHSRAAVVVSGTATAETAILGVPMVVCYHLSPLSYFLARLLVRVRYFSIPNLCADEPVVPEFIRARVGDIFYAVCRLIDDDVYRRQVIAGLERVKSLLGPDGAIDKIAQEVLGLNQQAGKDRAQM
jgi:lipid-A-disaccharide synthase